ncbi:uncharacterized protein LOC122128946 [Clupea harengus]|uniref:Uncharacterized protein LOC122128946 n=1 Tax=Clupea harengus TaxID=7950 RepID=A0A8M1KDG5_CLUHA|nr:uncharacterized protein LOC122128946 [Clupea harengus]
MEKTKQQLEDKNKEMEKTKKQLEEKNKLLQERETDLDNMTKRDKEREGLLENMTSKVETSKRQLESLEKELQDRNSQLQDLRTQLQEQSRELEERDRQLEERDRELEEREREHEESLPNPDPPHRRRDSMDGVHPNNPDPPHRRRRSKDDPPFMGGESPGPAPPVSPAVSELRLVLLGGSTAGKWAAGNTILGSEEFGRQASTHTSTHTSTETQHSESRQGEVAGRRVTVVETPDWFCSGLSEKDLRQDVGLCVSLSAPGPHAFLLVIPVEPSEGEEMRMLEKMEDMFGEGCWGHTLILFTHAEGLRERSVEELLQTGSQELQQLVEKCGNRCHLLNVKDRPDDTKITQLLEKIEEMVSGNRERFYSSETYQEAEKQLRVIERRIQKEREVEERKLREERERREELAKNVQESLKMMEGEIQQHEGEIRILNERTTELERNMKEERDEEKKREMERELKREITQREEMERTRSSSLLTPSLVYVGHLHMAENYKERDEAAEFLSCPLEAPDQGSVRTTKETHRHTVTVRLPVTANIVLEQDKWTEGTPEEVAEEEKIKYETHTPDKEVVVPPAKKEEEKLSPQEEVMGKEVGSPGKVGKEVGSPGKLGKEVKPLVELTKQVKPLELSKDAEDPGEEVVCGEVKSPKEAMEEVREVTAVQEVHEELGGVQEVQEEVRKASGAQEELENSERAEETRSLSRLSRGSCRARSDDLTI